MSDETDAALQQLRGLYGSGAPQRTTGTGAQIRDVATAPTSVDSWSGDAKNGFDSRASQNAADGKNLADTDDKVPAPVNDSADATARGRRSIDATTDEYRSGKAQLAPVSDTATGQAAILGLKTQKLKQGVDTVNDDQKAAATRSAAVRAFAANYLAKTQQGQAAAAQAAAGQQAMARASMQQAAMRSAMQQQAAISQSMMSSATPVATAATSLATAPATTTRSATAQATPTTAPVPSSAGGKVVQKALSKLGVPYVWGGGGPNGPTGGGFDCSSLMQYSYEQGAGVELPRTTYEQIKLGEQVSPSAAAPGDLVFSNFSSPGVPEHVQMSLGNGKVVEAQQTGTNIMVSNMPSDVVVKRVLK